jgi:hypothetical protein
MILYLLYCTILYYIFIKSPVLSLPHILQNHSMSLRIVVVVVVVVIVVVVVVVVLVVVVVVVVVVVYFMKKLSS